ncbi:NADPH-dependent FMN reductase Lot6 [Aspergillus affinis]|uniref:NADPH-dependent FMN reductase Lot6 n=1 Tax=Aspergillus affinis TaxID=1070780 RepID=UPI0022FE0AC6|nr:NADPH-dependent FMN reductase Lot6 [Aspergillus affinis]KAI9038232.1 NADPH-dependent FMN reductase Lot6 [Aspergillus affinis]
MAPKIGLIICSQRNPRVGPQVAGFVRQTIERAFPPTALSLIDLAEWNLTLCDEPGIPSQIKPPDEYTHAHARAWSQEIAAHDAFIFVTPQYNWGYPASIKNALDYLYHEWKGKPAMIVSYGGHGGGKAAEQLRQVLQGLRMTPVERTIPLTFPDKDVLLRGASGEDLRLADESSFWSSQKEDIIAVFANKFNTVLLVLATLANAARISERTFLAEDTITRDVCIIGGGATGTYAAIRLKDQGRSVIVVENSEYLGGHTETYDLGNGQHFDYGVEGVFNDPLSRNYFRRLGVDWRTLLPDTLLTENVNFETGIRVPPPNGTLSIVAGALLYRSVIEKYESLRDGTLNLPDPIHDDLWRPFGEFVTKHQLEGALSLIFTFSQEVGNLLDVPTLYVIQSFGLPQIDALLRGFMTPRNGGMDLYRKAAAVLGQDVLFSSSVTQTERSLQSVQAIVQGANGTTKLIRAQKLLIAMPPTLDNINTFDLDDTELEIFQKWKWNNYYVAVLNHTGIPDALSVINTQPENGPGSLPRTPFAWRLRYPGVSGYVTSEIIGDEDLTPRDATELIMSSLRRMKDAGTYNVTSPELLLLANHSPASPRVSAEDIRTGFYRKLYALQGRQSTFYTGRSFCADHSSILWAYTDAVIAKMFP